MQPVDGNLQVVSDGLLVLKEMDHPGKKCFVMRWMADAGVFQGRNAFCDFDTFNELFCAVRENDSNSNSNSSTNDSSSRISSSNKSKSQNNKTLASSVALAAKSEVSNWPLSMSARKTQKKDGHFL